MACAGNDVGCVAGEAGAGAMVGGAAVVADDWSDVGSLQKLFCFGFWSAHGG